MNDTAWQLITAYAVGLVVFAIVGFLEWAMSTAEMRRIDRDEWSRGEPWQRAHNHRARDREHVSIDHAVTVVMYSPIWPLLVAGVLVRMINRHWKERATHD